MAAFFLLCMSSLLLIVVSCYAVQLLKDARSHLPPGPWPLPVIGNVLQISRKLPHRSMACLAERYGPLMTVRLGTSLFVVASSPSTAREILQTHNASLSGRSPADAWSGAGHGANSVLVLPPRRKWRALRRLGTVRLFSPGRLEELRPLRQQVARELLRDVSEAAASRSGGAPASVQRAAFTAMVRLLWLAMFSEELSEATTRGLHDSVREAVDLVMTPNVSDFFPAVAALDIQGVRRRMATLIKRGYQLIDHQIYCRRHVREESRGGHARSDDLLDVMLDMSEQDDDGGVTINRDVIRAFCTDLFIAASDTTSNTIEWALAELLQNPETMRRLQEDIRAVLGSKPEVEDSDIERLPYLQAVIKETLRLHPAVPMLSYKAEATVQVQGYTIPEGSNVVVNVWAIHHSADVWPEPFKFMPERFLMHKEIEYFGRNFELLPFGSGRHICLGLPLANRMLPVMLGSLVHQFEWKLPDGARRSGVDMTEVWVSAVYGNPTQRHCEEDVSLASKN
ncbi:unnamed protein product [Urochloa decumbens]|uniref:Cytochrome P450 n=1 Tax=Urochloa decumbens TaxID=240449 RepID=A0ABC8WC76_9POAL